MLVTAGEANEFADALEMYIRDPDLRRHHGEAGLAVAQTMDWDTINSAVIRSYEQAIDKRERLARLSGLVCASLDPLDLLRGLVEDRGDLEQQILVEPLGRADGRARSSDS